MLHVAVLVFANLAPEDHSPLDADYELVTVRADFSFKLRLIFKRDL
jgi:hypothetical protein